MVANEVSFSTFCDRCAVDVAAELIGWDLQVNGVGGTIVETEAYTSNDPASHSFAGLRKTNASMWLPPGTSYVYRIYGVHFCLNVVCTDAGAVLIRAIEPTHSTDVIKGRRGQSEPSKWTSGPGKLCQALAVDLRLDGLPMDEPPFRLTPPSAQPTDGSHGQSIWASPRIGITRNTDVQWRFCATGSRFLSRTAGAGFTPAGRVKPKGSHK